MYFRVCLKAKHLHEIPNRLLVTERLSSTSIDFKCNKQLCILRRLLQWLHFPLMSIAWLFKVLLQLWMLQKLRRLIVLLQEPHSLSRRIKLSNKSSNWKFLLSTYLVGKESWTTDTGWFSVLLAPMVRKLCFSNLPGKYYGDNEFHVVRSIILSLYWVDNDFRLLCDRSCNADDRC